MCVPTDAAPTVDGFASTDPLTDLSWVQFCDDTATTMQYPGPNTPAPPGGTSVPTFLPKGAQAGPVAIHRTLTAAVTPATDGSAGTLSASLTVTFSFEVTGSVTATVHGKYFASVEAVPVGAADYLRPHWQGALTTTPTSGCHISDMDLFDTAPAAVLNDASPMAWPLASMSDATVVGQVFYVASLMADVATRAAPLEVLTSATSASVRAGFVTARSLPRPSSDTTFKGQLLVPTQSPPSEAAVDGALLHQAMVSCKGKQCPAFITSSLRDQVVAAAVRGTGMCGNPTVVPAATIATLSVDAAISGTSVVPRGMRAATTALFQCGSGPSEYVALSLQVTQSPEANTMSLRWPSSFFFNATESAVGLIKAVPLVPYGLLTGSLRSASGQAFSFVPTNLFGAGRGGVALPDSTNVDMVPTILATAAKAVATGNADIDAQATAALLATPSAAAQVLAKCRARLVVPTVLRCLHVYETMVGDGLPSPGRAREGAGVSVYAHAGGTGATIVFGLDDLSSSTPVVDATVSNAVAEAFHVMDRQVNLRLPVPRLENARSITGSTNARLAGAVSVSWVSGTPAAAVVRELQLGAMVSLDVEWSPDDQLMASSASLLVDASTGRAAILTSKTMWWWDDFDGYDGLPCGTGWGGENAWCDFSGSDCLGLRWWWFWGGSQVDCISISGWDPNALVGQLHTAAQEVDEYLQMQPRVLSTDIATALANPSLGYTYADMLNYMAHFVPPEQVDSYQDCSWFGLDCHTDYYVGNSAPEIQVGSCCCVVPASWL